MQKLTTLRKLSQILFFSLFVYILWSTTYPIKGQLPTHIFFKLDPLIMIMTSISERLILGGILFSAGMLLVALVFGRVFCGWACPLGFLMDFIGALSKKYGLNSFAAKPAVKNIKYAALGVIFVCALFKVQAAWILDPIVIAARFVSLNMIPGVTSLVDSAFVLLIKSYKLYDGTVYELYRAFKQSFLGVHVYYFANSLPIFIFFILVTGTALFLSRFWCRIICPLGAMYGLFGKVSLLERSVSGCANCGACVKICRMGAIKKGQGYIKDECVMCMDCVYTCPLRSTEFKWFWAKPGHGQGLLINEKGGITRRNFLFLLASSAVMLGAAKFPVKNKKVRDNIIRPPASLAEEHFVDRCVRCGNCMKVCVTNGLQPVMLEGGLTKMWTPRLVPEIGYCEYNCVLCGDVCPTQAITRLSVDKKRKVKLGLAEVDKRICIAWANKAECIVCEEHCPVSEKAIKREEETVDGKVIYKPVVDVNLCIGCGICQSKCPVDPVRAIRVNPKYADRF